MLEDVIRSLLNAPPSQRRVQEDIRLFNEETEEWKNALIPWEAAGEIELLSLNREEKWVKKRGNKYLRGLFRSIYNEPTFVFAFKNYLRNGLNATLWVRSMRHEFVYRCKRTNTDLYIDRDKVGRITENGLMYGGTKNRLLGRRNNFSESYYSVVIWDREIAHLVKPDKARRVNPRVFELLEKIEPKEELLLLALGYLTIVNETYDLGLAPLPLG